MEERAKGGIREREKDNFQPTYVDADFIISFITYLTMLIHLAVSHVS